MRGSATLERDAAAKALKDAGLGMGAFNGGPPPSLLAVRAVLRPAVADAAPLPDRPGPALARELPAVSEAAVEPDGRMTLLFRSGARPDPRALDAALARRGWTASGVKNLDWPATATAYVVTLRGDPEAAVRTRARTALERADGVLAAVLAVGRPELVVWLREPCASAADRLTPPLKDVATLASATPRPAPTPASRPATAAKTAR